MVVDIRAVRKGEGDRAHQGVAIDPRAHIDATAQLGDGCIVGPFAVIGPGVRLAANCEIYSHAVLQGPAEFGPNNVVHPFACLGGAPQDLRHRDEPTKLIVGAGNQFREYVTCHRGTEHGGGVTRIGKNNLFMAQAHVAHDCQVGNHVVMANQATVAGHVTIGDYVVFGGLVAVGSFLRIGESAMLAAGAMVERDVPPYCIVAGDRARLRAINRVGLDRRGIGPEARKQLKSIFRALRQKGRSLNEIVKEFSARSDLAPEAVKMIEFLGGAERGLTR